MNCGVYVLTSPSGGQYVGSSKYLSRRIRQHHNSLKRGCHFSTILQRAFDKYGPFDARVLLICSADDLVYFEQHAIDVLRPRYNRAIVVGQPIITAEIRAKMAAAKRGRKQSPELIAKRAAALRGLKRSAESLARYRAAAALRGVLPATRAKATAFNTGRPLSAEHRGHLSAANTGRTVSAETRKKISIANTGKRGRKDSILARAKKTAAQLTRWALRRQQKKGRYLVHNGRTQLLSEWATELNIPQSTIIMRLTKYNWSVTRALTTPRRKHF